MFQPWFLPFRIARAISSLLPADYRKRMRDCFDDYGCMRCGRLEVPYQSNGMCSRCVENVTRRIKNSAARRTKERLKNASEKGSWQSRSWPGAC